jgi:hypothetical protein
MSYELSPELPRSWRSTPRSIPVERDPARIDAVLAEVRRVWEAEPDLRLGQLICNAARVHTGTPDPFNLEDDKLVDALRAHGRWQV